MKPVRDLGVGPVAAPGDPVELVPGVRRLTAPNPGLMTGPGTNSYLIGSVEVAVVDPGPDDPAHLDALVAAAAAGPGPGAAPGTVRWVLVTHTHPDHAPGAAALAATTGAEVIGFDARDGFSPDRAAGDGWTLRGADFALRAVHTPGHASNHLCWLVEGHSMLLSGDHVMHGSTVVIRPPDGDMAAYLKSLRRLLALSPALGSIAPGHGRLIGDPARAIRGILDHRLERERVVLDALVALGSGTVDDLLATVYADVDEEHRRVGRYSLWAHLRKLRDEGRIDRTDADAGEGARTPPGSAEQSAGTGTPVTRTQGTPGDPAGTGTAGTPADPAGTSTAGTPGTGDPAVAVPDHPELRATWSVAAG